MFKKIQMDELKKGMKICALEKDDTGMPSFFMNVLLVKSEDDIEAFRGKGYGTAYIIADDSIAGPCDSDKQGRDFVKVQDIGFDEGASAQRTVEFEEEIYKALSLKDEAVAHVMELMTDIKVGKSVDTAKASHAVVRIIDSVFRNTDALTSLVLLKSYDTCTFVHSINVCILSVALGKELGMPREKLHELGMGAMLHDIGKLLIPEDILKKTGRYTEAEFAHMQRHAGLGADLLSRTKFIGDSAVLTARQHHEKIGGKGYPEGLSGDRIHEFGRIVCIADSYDAMTAHRPYRDNNFTPHEALQLMYFAKNIVYDEKLLETFIKCLGIYPAGSMVELSTGEIAVIKSVNQSNLLKTRAAIVLDRDKKRVANPVDVIIGGGEGITIKGSVNPKKFSIDLSRILGLN